MANNLVGYSRAGDEFHYRWAARRCLRIVYPNSTLRSVIIEGSKEGGTAGEYVIDVSEYYDEDGQERVEYYQLKHTTVHKHHPFLLNDLRDTFEGFSAKFQVHFDKDEIVSRRISFNIVTNRKFDTNFKANLSAIVTKTKVNKRFRSTIEKYTGLTSDKLISFCSIIKIEDGEGDYRVQKQELRVEIAQIIAGSDDNTQIETITALVKDKVLPHSDGKIVKEDVFKRFGVSSDRQLYPAEPIWDILGKTIKRDQHETLSKRIHSSANSVIIHAAGGVGKSVFTRQFIEALPEGSLGIAYDCFGAGKYRNRSEARHRHRDALVQIANELATKGLCDPLFVSISDSFEGEITRMFLTRLASAVHSLEEAYKNATLTILIDAADNAEMAAKEFNQTCFAHELLREKMPDRCKLVLLCRSERIHLLQPQSFIDQFELEPFSEAETFENLKNYFPDASGQDGSEFHRLTNGNPRVQANVLDMNAKSVEELLAKLGPAGTTVEDQIRLQLEVAVSRVRDLLPKEFQSHIDSICTGLASLSPNIPLDILAKAADVPTNTVKSFVADMGRSLWMSDSSVQFRDEPTETWFRAKFCASKIDFENYIFILEPLAQHSAYVSEILPQLYLQAEQYEKLITIAMSDDFLPHGNPIDARNVRVYRLQFAFKAALKSKKISDAVKLAMRAGEEVAGDQRQLYLLQENIELLVLLQSKEKIQNIAFRRLLSGNWKGSENIYSASLLSSIGEFQGEARGFLRASLNWLRIYFEESKKEKDAHREERLVDRDILELLRAKLNLDGVKGCLDFLFSLKPKENLFRIISNLTRNLIDTGSFEIIEELLSGCEREPYYIIAITSELHNVGRFPQRNSIEVCLALLCHPKSRIVVPRNIFNEDMIKEILCFLEACIYRSLSAEQILRVVKYYIPNRGSQMVLDSHFSKERNIFLRALAIRSHLTGKMDIDIEEILPDRLKDGKDGYEKKEKIKEFTQLIEGLLPWYLGRVEILSSQGESLSGFLIIAERSKKALSGRYKGYDPIPQEIAQIQLSILAILNKADNEQAMNFFTAYIKESKQLKIEDWLSAVRTAYRLPHLKGISREIQDYTYNLINRLQDNGPDEIADMYVSLARAILTHSRDDASVYFDDAINIVSKFGEEIGQRWEAVVALAKRACEGTPVSLDELSYRFIRIAEVVGDQKREKHWDRAEALQISARMSVGAGISALSRWRDREIGRFEWLHYAVFIELIKSNKIPPLKAWSLAPFCEVEQLKYFLSACITSPFINSNDKHIIFEDALNRFQLENSNIDYWYELDDLATSNGLKNDSLSFLMSNLGQNKKEKKDSPEFIKEYTPDLPWANIFDGHDLLTTKGLSDSYQKFSGLAKEKDQWFPRSIFWKGALSRVEERDFLKYIETLLVSEIVDHYDFQEILPLFPAEWLSKPSFKKNYRTIVTRLGSRFAQTMTSSYSFDSFIKALPVHKDNATYFSEGIVTGLANGNEFADAEIFFGFVRIASDLIDQNEAASLLDFSLSRFEMHIDEDFGDGPWSPWLEVAGDINNNLAGYIWSALGSPQSEARWRAAHSIQKLAKFNCVDVLESLFTCLSEDKVGAFGSKQYSFYNLHARQYLLIALSRISISNPEFLRSHSEVFSRYALGEKHLLIQRTASNVAINLESTFPGSYEAEILYEIKKVGQCINEIEAKYDYSTDSYWHEKDEVDLGIDFHFGWDFDSYWFEPLGNIFGVPGKQVQDLAANVVVKEWKIASSGYNQDTRVQLWNRSSRETSTHHDHGSYPKADNLDFYFSYHALMVVAAMLIKKMPVIRSDWDEDRWDCWLAKHSITRTDGRWLSEFRDQLPLKRPDWVYEENIKDWESKIDLNDFLNCLTFEENEKTWLNVRGSWQECKNVSKESYFITSALVSPDTADSLLNALDSCKDPHDFKLPSYMEDDMEIDSSPFTLKGWINERDSVKGLDHHDPFADELQYPPLTIGTNILSKLKLSISTDNKKYFAPISSDPSLLSETWISNRSSRDEEPDQSGIRLRCSLDFVKYLCRSLKCELILKVQIGRTIHSRYGSYNNSGYKPPLHKIFIISADGKLRGTEVCSQLGRTLR